MEIRVAGIEFKKRFTIWVPGTTEEEIDAVKRLYEQMGYKLKKQERTKAGLMKMVFERWEE